MIDDGQVKDDGTAIDRPIRQDLVAALVSGSGKWLWRTTQSTTKYDTGGTVTPLGPDPAPRVVSYVYDALGNIQDTYGTLSGTLALGRSHEDPSAPVAPAPPNASVAGSKQLGHFVYDAYGNLVTASKPLGACKAFEYGFDPYYLRPGTITEYTGGGCATGEYLRSFMSYDPGFGVLTSMWTAGSTKQSAEYDAFGRLVRAFGPRADIPGETQLDLQLEYSEKADGSHIQIVHVTRGQAPWLETYHYLDGYGRPFLTLRNGDGAAFIASGLARKNMRGDAFTLYRPWQWTGDPLDYPIAVPEVESATFVRDALGRVSTTIRNNDIEGVVKRHALFSEYWDAEDLDSAGSHYGTPTRTYLDGHGRVQKTQRDANIGGTADVLISEFGYTATGEMNGIKQSHGAGAESYQRWMRYDTLGRMVENAEPHASASFTTNWAASSAMKAWRYAYDDAGRLVGTSDARGCGENLIYDSAGRLQAEDYSPCLRQQAPYSAVDLTTGSGSEAFYQYDGPEPGQTDDLPLSPGFSLGRLVSVRDRASHTRFVYDGRGRVVTTARRIVQPGEPSSNLDLRYAGHWFHSTNDFDELDRLRGQSTGAESADLLVDGQSNVTFAYGQRGMLSQIGSSYGTLVASQEYEVDGSLKQRVFGDLAGTTETFEYDSKQRLSRHSAQRVAPLLWSGAVGAYTPPVDPTESLQTNVLDELITYDRVGNATQITDVRDPWEWPSGARPVTRSMQYDDLYRVTRVDYGHAFGSDPAVSPFAAEESAGSNRPVPRRNLPDRPQWQSFAYDWFGSTSATLDDAVATYDRSLGTITNGQSTGKPGQLRSSVQLDGGTAANYDAAGHLVDLQVGRDGACSAPTGMCFQRFVYDWDEVGHLAKARRYDYASAASVPVYPTQPTGFPAADLTYAYGIGGRVLKTASDGAGAARYTVDVFPSLRLLNAAHDGTDYEQDVGTETVYLAGVGRVVNDATLPSPSASSVHVFLQLGDHLGSTSVVFDKETSELVQRSTYQPYGAAESDHRPARWNAFREEHRFTGKEDDIEVGITYFGERYYHAHLGRWLSPDPLTIHAAGADLNPYAYVSGRTFNAVDAYGLSGGCTENQDCQGGGNFAGDLKGWGRALEDAGKGIGRAASAVVDAISDGWNAIIGGGDGPSAPTIRRITETIQFAKAVLPSGPLTGIAEQLGVVIGQGLVPGASFTAKGFAIGAAGDAMNQLAAASGPIAGPLVSSFTPALPATTPGDVGPAAGKLFSMGVALAAGAKMAGGASATGGAGATLAAAEGAEVAAAEGASAGGGHRVARVLLHETGHEHRDGGRRRSATDASGSDHGRTPDHDCRGSKWSPGDQLGDGSASEWICSAGVPARRHR